MPRRQRSFGSAMCTTPPSHMSITRSSIAQAAMHRLVIICVAILAVMESLCVASPANSATITVNAPDAYGRTFVDVVGEIDANDDATFEKKVTVLHAHVDKVIVTLSGPGGVALTAMKIGELIHKNGWGTYVPSGTLCTSSCSIIWLACMWSTSRPANSTIETCSTRYLPFVAIKTAVAVIIGTVC